MSQPHDRLVRRLFRRPEEAASLLRSALPPEIAREIDWSSLVRIPGTMIDAAGREHRSDLLYSARVGGARVLLYLLLEHKAEADADTPFQLLRYMVRIWEYWRDEHPTGPLPPILPFVLHHGTRAWTGPMRLQQHMALSGMSPMVARFVSSVTADVGFVLDDLATQSESDIAARSLTISAWLGALFLQHGRGRSAADVEKAIARWQDILMALLSESRWRRMEMLWWYLWQTTEASPRRVLRRLPSRLRKELEKTLMSTAERLREQGLAEGKVKGRRELLLRQLSLRFGPLQPTVEARLQAATIADLDRWGDRVLTATTIEDVLAP